MRIAWFDTPETEVFSMEREIIRGEPNSIRRSPNQYGVSYTSIPISLGIAKDPCYGIDMEISYDESRAINKWLAGTGLYQDLIFDGVDDVYHVVCTRITDVTYGGRDGKLIEFESNSPYAFSKSKTEVVPIVDSPTTLRIFNNTDDTSDYYPIWHIKAIDSYIKIENLEDNSLCELNFATLGTNEIILDGQHFRVTDKNGVVIPFYKMNWDHAQWPHFVPGLNNIKITGKCNLSITYHFARRVGVL